MDMKLRCQNMCAIESLLKSHEHAATTLESESRRRERPAVAHGILGAIPVIPDVRGSV